MPSVCRRDEAWPSRINLKIAEGADVLKDVLHRQNFDAVFSDAIIHPSIAVLAENLSVLRSLHVGEGLEPDMRIIACLSNGNDYVVAECGCIIWIEVLCDITACRSKTFRGTFCPFLLHHATANFCLRFLAREGFVAFLIASSVILITSSVVYTSPRSDSPSPTRMSS